MDRRIPRQTELSRLRFFPAPHDSRAVFMVEVSTPRDTRRIREVFRIAGRLLEVVPIAHGRVMCFALRTDGDPSFFTKLEWILKGEFPFSIVERNCSDVSLRLARDLCASTDTILEELPECGVCGRGEPFPLLATAREADSGRSIDLHYCARCAGENHSPDPRELIRRLVQQDRRRFSVPPGTPISVAYEPAEADPDTDGATDYAEPRLAMAS